MRTPGRTGPWGWAVLAAVFLGAPGAGAQHVEELGELMRRAGRILPPVAKAQAGFSDRGWARRVGNLRARGAAVDGTLPVLLVPALFQDSDAPPGDSEQLRQVFFQGPSTTGTLPEFFAEASAGALTVTGAVASWSRSGASRDSATGGPDNVLGIGPGFGGYLFDALRAADAELDFGEFDNDGPDGVPNSGDDDGVVDALTFLFAEVARSCGGNGVWPHKSALAAWNDGRPYLSDDTDPLGDPISANGYVIISASECDGTLVDRVAVVAHELGHELQLPDLYHPVGEGMDALLSVNRRWVVGCFGLMAAGSWGCGPADLFPAFGPTHFSAWSRDQLGWVQAEAVPAGEVRRGEFFLDPAISSGKVLEIPLSDGGEESLVVEYRIREGFDEALPASGVLLYRQVSGAPFRPSPDGPRRYRISLLEADGDSALLRTHGEGGNRGEAGDVFALGESHGILSAATHPGTRLTDGTASTVTIHRIEILDRRARLVVSTARDPGLVHDPGTLRLEALQEVDESYLLGGGALPYAVHAEPGSLPAGLSLKVRADTLALEGTVRETGAFSAGLSLTDARSTVASAMLSIEIARLIIDDQALLEALLDPSSSALTPEERDVLDQDGNRSGSYDAGDLRAYLFGG